MSPALPTRSTWESKHGDRICKVDIHQYVDMGTLEHSTDSDSNDTRAAIVEIRKVVDLSEERQSVTPPFL